MMAFDAAGTCTAVPAIIERRSGTYFSLSLLTLNPGFASGGVVVFV